MIRKVKIADKDRETPHGCCPKCGYFLIKFSPIAECARCEYKASRKEYGDYIAKENGEKN